MIPNQNRIRRRQVLKSLGVAGGLYGLHTQNVVAQPVGHMAANDPEALAISPTELLEPITDRVKTQIEGSVGDWLNRFDDLSSLVSAVKGLITEIPDPLETLDILAEGGQRLLNALESAIDELEEELAELEAKEEKEDEENGENSDDPSDDHNRLVRGGGSIGSTIASPSAAATATAGASSTPSSSLSGSTGSVSSWGVPDTSDIRNAVGKISDLAKEVASSIENAVRNVDPGIADMIGDFEEFATDISQGVSGLIKDLKNSIVDYIAEPITDMASSVADGLQDAASGGTKPELSFDGIPKIGPLEDLQISAQSLFGVPEDGPDLASPASLGGAAGSVGGRMNSFQSGHVSSPRDRIGTAVTSENDDCPTGLLERFDCNAGEGLTDCISNSADDVLLKEVKDEVDNSIGPLTIDGRECYLPGRPAPREITYVGYDVSASIPYLSEFPSTTIWIGGAPGRDCLYSGIDIDGTLATDPLEVIEETTGHQLESVMVGYFFDATFSEFQDRLANYPAIPIAALWAVATGLEAAIDSAQDRIGDLDGVEDLNETLDDREEIDDIYDAWGISDVVDELRTDCATLRKAIISRLETLAALTEPLDDLETLATAAESAGVETPAALDDAIESVNEIAAEIENVPGLGTEGFLDDPTDENDLDGVEIDVNTLEEFQKESKAVANWLEGLSAENRSEIEEQLGAVDLEPLEDGVKQAVTITVSAFDAIVDRIVERIENRIREEIACRTQIDYDVSNHLSDIGCHSIGCHPRNPQYLAASIAGSIIWAMVRTAHHEIWDKMPGSNPLPDGFPHRETIATAFKWLITTVIIICAIILLILMVKYGGAVVLASLGIGVGFRVAVRRALANRAISLFVLFPILAKMGDGSVLTDQLIAQI